MRRLGLWLRWSWRDLRGRWALVLAIAAVLAVGTGVYTGLGSMENWRVASNDASFASLSAHDVEVSLTEGTRAPAGSLEALARRIPAAGDVAAAAERLVVPTQVEVRGRGSEPLITPGEIVGAPLDVAVNRVYAEGGRTLRPADEGRPVAVLETNFAAVHELPPTGELRFPGGERLAYAGVGGAPEYFLVTRPGGGDFGGAESQFAVVFTSLETAQRAAGVRGVDDLVLRLRPGADAGRVRGQLEQALRDAGLSGRVTTLADETAHRVLYSDAEGDQQLFNVFALLILAGAALAAFNLATRIVEAQRREIGIGMALGVPPGELAVRPLVLGAQIALAGTALGLALGLLMGEIFRGVLEDLVPLPQMRTPFEAGVFVRGALIGLVLPILATAIPVWRGLRRTPVEAIRVGFRSARSSGLAGLAKRVRLPGSSLAQLPLRNVLRAPRRTAMTVLGIGTVLTVLVAFQGLIDSFLTTVDRSEAEAAQTNPGRLTVALDGPQGEDSATLRAIRGTPGVAEAEPRLELPVTLSAPGGAGFEGALTVLDFSSPVWAPTIERGDAPSGGEPGVVISREAARDLGVAVGDRLTLTAPQRRGGRLAETTATVPVAGLHPDPFRNLVYAGRGAAAAAGLAGAANQVAVTPAPGASESEIARALFDVPGVVSVQSATATTDFLRERLDDFVGVLRLIEAFGLALALLIAFNSASIGADERRRENATMLAFGVPAGGAVGLGVAESLITGLLGTLVGIGGGLLVVGWVANETLPQTLPDLGLVISISAGSLLTATLVGVVAVSLAPLLTARRIRRMNVPSALRVVE